MTSISLRNTLPAGILSGFFLQAATAGIVAIDIADERFLVTSHLGSDTIILDTLRGGGNVVRVTGDGTPTIGAKTISELPLLRDSFTQGTSLTIDFGTPGNTFYVETGIAGPFIGGATPGLNYARLDLDGNSVFETVIEFNTGADETFIGDVITRYFYDMDGNSLTIPDAVANPEPSSSLLIVCGLAFGAARRRR